MQCACTVHVEVDHTRDAHADRLAVFISLRLSDAKLIGRVSRLLTQHSMFLSVKLANIERLRMSDALENVTISLYPSKALPIPRPSLPSLYSLYRRVINERMHAHPLQKLSIRQSALQMSLCSSVDVKMFDLEFQNKAYKLFYFMMQLSGNDFGARSLTKQ